MTPASSFDPDTYADLRRRIDLLTPETVPRWGKMNAAQMCAHCAEVAAVAHGKPLRGTPWLIQL